jgi:hypothetical protein
VTSLIVVAVIAPLSGIGFRPQYFTTRLPRLPAGLVGDALPDLLRRGGWERDSKQERQRDERAHELT